MLRALCGVLTDGRLRGVSSQHAPAAGIVLRSRLFDLPLTADVLDRAGDADGVLHGSAAISGGSLLLDGTSGCYLQLPIGVAGNSEGWTVSCLFRFDAAFSGYGGLFGQWIEDEEDPPTGPKGTAWVQALASSGGNVRMGANGDLIGNWAPGTLADNAWHLVIARLASDGAPSLRVDGVELLENEQPVEVPGGAHAMRVGEFEGTGERFRGRVKHLRGWDGWLTDEECAAVESLDLGI